MSTRRLKGASFKAGAGMIQSAFIPVPVLEPEPPVPGLGAVLAPLALGHSPALLHGVTAVPQDYSVDGNRHSPSVGDASHVPFAPG
jgi:hypothetical protein